MKEATPSSVAVPPAPQERAVVDYARPAGDAGRQWPRWTRLLWPLAAKALILLFNFFFTPDFFELRLFNGRVTGRLIDILNNGAPVMLLALGMTLVIGTGGIDLSVGAVMAMSGAMAACLLAPPFGSPLV